MKPKSCVHKVAIRGKTSDVLLFYQIFCRQVYPIPTSGNFSIILDVGANVGYVALWFASQLPDSDVIAIEMEHGNYFQLKKNTKPYKNIELIHAALWPRDEPLKILNPQGSN